MVLHIISIIRFFLDQNIQRASSKVSRKPSSTDHQFPCHQRPRINLEKLENILESICLAAHILHRLCRNVFCFGLNHSPKSPQHVDKDSLDEAATRQRSKTEARTLVSTGRPVVLLGLYMPSTTSFASLGDFLACIATPRRSRRVLFLVHGPDTVPFLQGLCTAHVTRLASQQLPVCSGACFLDRRGRVLFDTLLWIHSAERVYLELDERAAELAQRHLTLHRLRTRVHWERVAASLFIHAGTNLTPVTSARPSPVSIAEVEVSPSCIEMQAFDPRLPILGKRIWKLTRPGTGVRTAVEQSSRSARCYHSFWLAELHRVLHAVPQGTRDVVPGQALPLECNFEQLGAIAFDKGCYLGQELTARTHYTGVVRKRTVAGVLSPDHEDALARAQQAAAFVQTVHRGGKDQVATLFPAQTLHWPVPEALQQQLIHDSQKRIELELVQGASPAGTRTRATLGTVVANLATALVSLADTDLDTSSTTMSHLFQIPEQVSSPIAKWFFAWWVPPYLQNAGSVSSASPVSRPSLS